MELDSFLATPRWDILRIIIDKPSSPLKIAEEMGTTTSFISQQLKLLEAKGIVKKERTGEVEKGKPRSLFSITKEAVYITPLTKQLPSKKLIPLTREHKITLQIWGIENSKIQLALEKFFWKIQEHLDNIDAIAIYIKDDLAKIYIIPKNENATRQLNNIKEPREKDFDLRLISSVSPLLKLETGNLVPIYDPESMVLNNLKGGLENE